MFKAGLNKDGGHQLEIEKNLNMPNHITLAK